MGTEVAESDLYVRRTLRATAALLVAVIGTLLRLGWDWALVPMLAGLLLAVVLFLGWNVFLKVVLAPPDGEKSLRMSRWRGQFVLLALVKYPLVGWLLWWLSRNWESRQLAAFVAGFSLLQLVIALRAVGKLLTEGKQRRN